MKRYKDYSSYLNSIFPTKIQKISINAGFTCPNRDGKVGKGGCTYCNNQTFNPEYCKPSKTITQQLDEGIRFFQRKYSSMEYLAYFQAYTNTYDKLEILKEKFEEALSHPLVKGIVVGTRPDCMNHDLLDYFSQLASTHYVMIEYGVESTCNETLSFINRGHSYEKSIEAIIQTAEKGIPVGAHLIIGLPLEDKETILLHAKRISQLPLTSVKLHQLQLIKGTKMAEQFNKHPEWFNLYSVEEYVETIVDFIELLNPEFVIERFVSQSPKELLIAPDWGLKNYEFTAKIDKELLKRDTYQGKFFQLTHF
jgi:radical SAM protein (TIGR01212 family)